MKIIIAISMLLLVTVTASLAQRVAPYKITAIKIQPFDELTGKLHEELDPTDHGAFFNDLGTSILALIELTGEPGKYAEKRTVAIRVMEGRKLKLTKIGDPGVISDSGHYYIPVWIQGPVCDNVTITARMVGQTVRSSMTRQLDAHCGE